MRRMGYQGENLKLLQEEKLLHYLRETPL